MISSGYCLGWAYKPPVVRTSEGAKRFVLACIGKPLSNTLRFPTVIYSCNAKAGIVGLTEL